MEHTDLPSRTAVLETNEKNIFHQLTEIKEELRALGRLTSLCETISVRLGALSEKLGDVEARLQRLERAPGEDLRHYRRSTVVCLITGAVGVLFGILSLITGGI